MSDSDEGNPFLGGGPNPFAGGVGLGGGKSSHAWEGESSEEDERPAKRTKLFTSGGSHGMKFVKKETIQPKEIPKATIHMKDSEGKNQATSPDEADSSEHENDDDEENPGTIDPRFQFQFDASSAQQRKEQGPQMPSKVHRSDRQLADDFSNPVLAYMKKMGWKGGGLGVDEQGRANPLKGAYGRKKNQAIQEDGETKQEEDDRKKPDQRSARDILLGGATGEKSTRDVIPGLGTHMSKSDRQGFIGGRRRQKDKNEQHLKRRDREVFYETEDGDGFFEEKTVQSSTMRIVDMTQARGARIIGGAGEIIAGSRLTARAVTAAELRGSLMQRTERPLDDLLTGLSDLVLRTDQDADVLRRQVTDYRSSLEVLQDGQGVGDNLDGEFGTSSGSSSSGADGADVKKTRHRSRRHQRRTKRRAEDWEDVLEGVLNDLEVQFKHLDSAAGLVSSFSAPGYITSASSTDAAATVTRVEAELIKVIEYFEEVLQAHGPAFWADFTLEQLCAEHLLPIFRHRVNLWNPLDESDELDPVFERIRDLLVLGSSATLEQTQNKQQRELFQKLERCKAYKLLTQATVYPKIRTAISSPDCRPADSPAACGDCLLLFTTASNFLPSFCITNLARLNLVPKLREQAQKWDCVASEGFLSWIPAFREYLLESDLREIARICKQNVARYFSGRWQPLEFCAAARRSRQAAAQQLLEEDEQQDRHDINKVPAVDDSIPPASDSQLTGPALVRNLRRFLSDEDVYDLEQRVILRLREAVQPDDSDEVLFVLAPWYDGVAAPLGSNVSPSTNRRRHNCSNALLLLAEELFFQPLRQNLKRILAAICSSDAARMFFDGAGKEKRLYNGRTFLRAAPLASSEDPQVNRVKTDLTKLLTRFYRRVRARFADATLAQNGDLAMQFSYLLEVFECYALDQGKFSSASSYVLDLDGLETGPALQVGDKGQLYANRGNSGLSEREKTLRRYADMLKEDKQRAALRQKDRQHMEEPDMGLREVLEQCAAEQNVAFVEKKGFVSASGKQWFTFGKKHFIYWENDICFYTTSLQAKDKIFPTSLENLLQIVKK
ncbi:unnamed protein product [Amoebophrya sp. A120]|nr:unnamed protein product [Amoebophrya sp. A120]|eukprot:GSA120T00015430001.1